MKKLMIVAGLIVFSFFANAQTGTTEVKQATPVMKVDGAGTTHNCGQAASGESAEKKACCQKGAEEGKACCKDGANGECKHHGKNKGKEKDCCKRAAKKGKTCEHHNDANGKSCNHGSTTPTKTCPHSEGTK